MGGIVERYVHDWTLGIEDVTKLAQEVKRCIDEGAPLPSVPSEVLFEVSAPLAANLQVTPAQHP